MSAHNNRTLLIAFGANLGIARRWRIVRTLYIRPEHGAEGDTVVTVTDTVVTVT